MKRKYNEIANGSVAALTFYVLLLLVGLFVSPALAGYDVVDVEPAAATGDAQVVGGDQNGPEAQSETVETATEPLLSPLREVTINLRGATAYETVEIFNSLLQTMPLLRHIDRVRMVIAPSRPGMCIATWKVTTREQDTFTLESQLYGMIKDLTRKSSNDVLAGVHFVVVDDDVDLVKTIIPVSATVSVLDFQVGGHQERQRYSRDERGLLYAGFD